MAYKKIPTYKIRKNRIYKMVDLAAVLGVCPATVWGWVQKGLPVIDKSVRPWLFDGEEVKVHLDKRIKASKLKMLYYQFNCFSCRGIVSIVPDSIKIIFLNYIDQDEKYFTVRISGICSDCGHKTNRSSTNKKMIELLEYYGKSDTEIEFE